MSPFKIHIKTLGCPKNDVDSEIIAGMLTQENLIITTNIEDADIAIINTCGFIEPAKIESIDEILYAVDLKVQKKLKKIYVFGCLVQRYRNELKSELPEVDGFFGVSGFGELLKTISNKELSCRNPFLLRINYSHFAYLKISEGCSNHCSYCTIPSIKGEYRSRSLNEILEEVELLNDNGVKELILVSQDTGRYGNDINENLIDLVEKISKYENFKWIRLLYVHPKHINKKFTEIFKINKVLPYLDLPVQHSSTNILKHMNRGYTNRDLLKKIETLKKHVDNIVLRTSIIVGFPGETEDDFIQLSGFIKDTKFDHLGVFTYSNEEGTSAAEMKSLISEEIKVERKEEILLLQADVSSEQNRSFIGKKMNIIIDNIDEETGVYVGRTYRDSPEIDGIVKVKKSNLQVGEIYNFKIKGAGDFELKV